MSETAEFKRCAGMSYAVEDESGAIEFVTESCDRKAPKLSDYCKRHRPIELVIRCEVEMLTPALSTDASTPLCGALTRGEGSEG